MRDTLLKALRREFVAWRETRSLKVRWAKRVEASLNFGLQLMEMASCSSDETDQRIVDRWRGELMAVVPPSFKFVGRPLAFSLTDPEQVVSHVTTKYKYHEHPHKDVQFAVAVQCFAHYCAVCSTRVYIACLTPHPKKKKKARKLIGTETDKDGEDED